MRRNLRFSKVDYFIVSLTKKVQQSTYKRNWRPSADLIASGSENNIENKLQISKALGDGSTQRN